MQSKGEVHGRRMDATERRGREEEGKRKEEGGLARGRLAALAGGGLGLVGFGRGVVENKVPRECSLALGNVTVSRSMSN